MLNKTKDILGKKIKMHLNVS